MTTELTDEEKAYKDLNPNEDDSGALETAPAGEQEVDQPQPEKPRVKLLIRCKACGKSARVLLMEGSHTLPAAHQVARWYEHLKCGNCGERFVRVPGLAGDDIFPVLMVTVHLAPRNWIQRLLRMK